MKNWQKVETAIGRSGMGEAWRNKRFKHLICVYSIATLKDGTKWKHLIIFKAKRGAGVVNKGEIKEAIKDFLAPKGNEKYSMTFEADLPGYHIFAPTEGEWRSVKPYEVVKDEGC